MSKKILVTASRYSQLCTAGKAMLEAKGYEIMENTTGKRYSTAQLKEIIPDIDGVIVGLDDWNEEVFKVAKKLKILAKFGVGYDNIDVSKAREYGILTTIARGQNASAVAEMAVAQILACVRNLCGFNETVRTGYWDRTLHHELEGMTVGLLGFGMIARKTARMLSGFDVHVIASDKYPNAEEADKLHVDMVSFDDVITESDVISLHIPGTPENHHLIDAGQISKMKDGAFLVNTSRGSLIDLEALKQALESGKLAAAGLDVYEKEPADESEEMFRTVNTVCTPHCAGKTFEAYQKISIHTAQAVIDVLEGRLPQDIVTE